MERLGERAMLEEKPDNKPGTGRAGPLGVDFAALNTLHVVHAQGSFSRAAEVLGLNQSAVSYTIDKLRKVFADPLFLRVEGQQMPTARCEQILSTTRTMLDDFLRLAEPDPLDLALIEGRYVIACNYYERMIIIPEIVRDLRQAAPGFSIEIIPSADIGPDQLVRSHADLLLGPFRRNDAAFYSRKLFDEHYVCAMDRDHPLAGKPLTLEDYLALDHVAATYGGLWKSGYLRALEAMGHRLKPSLEVPSPAGLPRLIRTTGYVATMPGLLAQYFSDELHITPCPVPAPFDVLMVWTERVHKSPLHRQIRDIIAQSVSRTLGRG
ncbi:LysR family transcriptional regulator [Pannonibacter phragmitetus]|uniref:LysR family transcriptional regulator n=1 Tax=Pannonibacter phragmitetus TaxID=121719 RepID=UPI000F44F4D9|nr:LysR family transcriptional regulator [Pannonibacter phragmitetus]MBA4203643.1 LysR family transcriptional regulator [Polymorphum sp.]